LVPKEYYWHTSKLEFFKDIKRVTALIS
jgi:hypothetical protein